MKFIKFQTPICSFIFFVLEFGAIFTAKIISWWSVLHLCGFLLSHTSTDRTFLFKANHYFSLMHQVRGANKSPKRKFTNRYQTWNLQVTSQICFLLNYLSRLYTTQSRLLTTSTEKPFENIVEKGENAGNQHFLLFPQCFLPFPKQVLIFYSNLFCRLRMLSIWTSLNFCCLVKRLITWKTWF